MLVVVQFAEAHVEALLMFTRFNRRHPVEGVVDAASFMLTVALSHHLRKFDDPALSNIEDHPAARRPGYRHAGVVRHIPLANREQPG